MTASETIDFLRMEGENGKMDLPLQLPLLLAGTTGENPAVFGVPRGECAEKWMAVHPDSIARVLNGFSEAGAQALCAPTAGANRACLDAFGLGDEAEEINKSLVESARKAARAAGTPLGGAVGPTGLFVPPFGNADFDDVYDICREQIRALNEAEVDFLFLCSQTCLSDMRAALLAARTTNLPVFVSASVDGSGRTLTGGSLLPSLITLQAMGADAVGLRGPFAEEDVREEILGALPHASVPLILQPLEESPADETAEKIRPLFRAGASVLCGETPELVRAMKSTAEDYRPAAAPSGKTDCYAAAIEREAFFLGEDLSFSPPIRCSSTLGEELIDLDDEQVSAALVQVCSLDDARVLGRNSSMTRLPIAVRADSPVVLDAALRYFQGRLIVDSDCPIEREILEPLAAKYGAIVY